ncbi:MAG: glycosyltransferase family 4 protein [Bacteroidales bacterium]|nr:glycosyltransferase family 4 protein [Bacteroidales bacterium]
MNQANKKKVLIITYYWPPSGGAGVQRWLKFVKYLSQYGWDPIVYTPDNGEIPVTDKSLQKDIPEGTKVIKRKIWEPYTWYKKFIGQKNNQKINVGFLSEAEKPKFTEKISVWIRGNFFIPDARKFWIKPSVKFLKKYLVNNHVDAIISTGPPHSMHLIALQLQKKLSIPWIADFRDPWTNIDFYEDLLLTKRADKKHHKLEKKVLQNANCILSVGETLKNEFVELGANNVKVITNGYDSSDMDNSKNSLDKKFSIVHIGSMPKSRNPELLWKIIDKIVRTNKDFAKYLEIKLVGKCDYTVKNSLEKYNLSNFVNKIDYVSHKEISAIQQSAQILLLVINKTKNAKGILTGKFFEYMAAKRPIFAIGPTEGDAAKILMKTNSGVIADFKDTEKIEKTLLSLFEKYKNSDLYIESSDIDKYSRKNLTWELANTLDSII